MNGLKPLSMQENIKLLISTEDSFLEKDPLERYKCMYKLFNEIMDSLPEIPCTVVGMQDGKHEIHSEEFNTIENAISRCFSTNTFDYKIYQHDNEYWLETKHRDGINRYIITPKQDEENS